MRNASVGFNSLATAAALGASVAAGISYVSAESPYTPIPVEQDSGAHLPLCYDTLQPPVERSSYNSLPPLIIKTDENGYSKDFPNALARDTSTVDDAIARISYKITTIDASGRLDKGTAYGSGFLTHYNDQDFLVTAAHVIGTAELEDITVTDNNHEQAGVVDGCFMYEDQKIDSTKRTQVHVGSEDSGSQIDVAVLKLTRKLGTTTLALSQNPAASARQNSVYFSNYQANAPIGNPAHYSGLIVRSPGTTHTIDPLVVMTGLEERNVLDLQADSTAKYRTSLEAGGSGGVVTDKDDEVVGISVSVSHDSATSMQFSHNVIFDGAEPANPAAAYVVPAEVVRLALQSPKLTPSFQS